MALPRKGSRQSAFVSIALGLLAVFGSCVIWAQDGEPPTVVTLVPTSVTEASATLRAEVNPKGLPTIVEFFLARQYPPFEEHSVGRIDAGSGTIATLVDLRVVGLDPHGDYYFRAEATNSLGNSIGFSTELFLDVGSTASKEINYAHVAFFPVREISERDANFAIEVDPRGQLTVVEVYLTYPKGGVVYDGTKIGERKLLKEEGVARLQFRADGLWRGFTYWLVVKTHRPGPLYDIIGDATYIFTTPGEPGHNAPEFDNVALRVPIGSTKSFTRLVAPFDPDGDIVSIESVSQPQHGAVNIAVMEWIYTPDTTYDGTDQFSVTVVDSKGERTTRIVQIYDAHLRAFEFNVPINWSISDPPRPAGRLSLSTTVKGAFTGKVSIFADEFVLHGNLDQFNAAVLELDRRGLPPLIAELALVPGIDGEMHLSANIHAPELGSSYVAEGLPLGDAETTGSVGGLRYSAVVPMHAQDEAATLAKTTSSPAGTSPRGDGFLVGTVTKKGHARFAGRTGDGQTFTTGGRLQRDRRLQISTSAGKQPRDYIVGHLAFADDANKTISGSLGWLSTRSVIEYYASDFSKIALPQGAMYRKLSAGLTNVFGQPGGSNNVTLAFADESGAPLSEVRIGIDRFGKGSVSGVTVAIDKSSGVFRGVFQGASASDLSRFTGVLVQPLKLGGGHLLMNGPVGAVTIKPTE